MSLFFKSDNKTMANINKIDNWPILIFIPALILTIDKDIANNTNKRKKEI